MKATISAIETRTPQSVSFEVDESNFTPETSRTQNTSVSLDGTAITTDWGYVTGQIEIALNNILLTDDQYSDLVGMQRDSDGYEFVFSYKDRISKVIILNIPVSSGGDPKVVGINLKVVSEFDLD